MDTSPPTAAQVLDEADAASREDLISIEDSEVVLRLIRYCLTGHPIMPYYP